MVSVLLPEKNYIYFRYFLDTEAMIILLENGLLLLLEFKETGGLFTNSKRLIQLPNINQKKYGK